MLVPVLSAGFFVVAYLLFRARVVELKALSVESDDVFVHDLPRVFDGFLIAQISDMHWRGFGAYESDVLEQLVATSPDMIAVTGDFLEVEGQLDTMLMFLDQARQVAPLYAVFGDNDCEDPVQEQRLRDALQVNGIQVLNNEHVAFRRENDVLWVVGVADPHTERANLKRALPVAGNEPLGPTVLLAHSPEIFPEAIAEGVDLVLAGHTHGGQVCLPGGIPITTNLKRCPRRWASGLATHGGSWLHVSRGVGWARLPLRLFCRPELALITLRRQGGKVDKSADKR